MASLYVSRDHPADWLTALEYGRVVDGQPESHFRPVGPHVRLVLDGPEGRVVGFVVEHLRAFDDRDITAPMTWYRARFDVPLFGLCGVAPEVVVQCALRDYAWSSTTNRGFFGLAVDASDVEESIRMWRACLESGDCQAHYGLGLALLEVGRASEARRHLAAYTSIAPWHAWAWRNLSRAESALGADAAACDALARAASLQLAQL